MQNTSMSNIISLTWESIEHEEWKVENVVLLENLVDVFTVGIQWGMGKTLADAQVIWD